MCAESEAVGYWVQSRKREPSSEVVRQDEDVAEYRLVSDDDERLALLCSDCTRCRGWVVACAEVRGGPASTSFTTECSTPDVLTMSHLCCIRTQVQILSPNVAEVEVDLTELVHSVKLVGDQVLPMRRSNAGLRNAT